MSEKVLFQTDSLTIAADPYNYIIYFEDHPPRCCTQLESLLRTLRERILKKKLCRKKLDIPVMQFTKMVESAFDEVEKGFRKNRRGYPGDNWRKWVYGGYERYYN